MCHVTQYTAPILSSVSATMWTALFNRAVILCNHSGGFESMPTSMRNPSPAAVPFLLNPSFAKVVYLTKLREFWNGISQAGSWNLSVVIIGY